MGPRSSRAALLLVAAVPAVACRVASKRHGPAVRKPAAKYPQTCQDSCTVSASESSADVASGWELNEAAKAAEAAH